MISIEFMPFICPILYSNTFWNIHTHSLTNSRCKWWDLWIYSCLHRVYKIEFEIDCTYSSTHNEEIIKELEYVAFGTQSIISTFKNRIYIEFRIRLTKTKLRNYVLRITFGKININCCLTDLTTFESCQPVFIIKALLIKLT